MSGFYIAPFARIAKYTVDMPFDFKEEIYDPQDGTYLTTVEGEIPLHGKINSFTGGLLFGAQWKIAKQVFLDWWILGPHYGSANGSVLGKKTLSKIRKLMTPSGQGTTRYSSILSQDFSSNNHSLNLRSTFVNLSNFCIPH